MSELERFDRRMRVLLGFCAALLAAFAAQPNQPDWVRGVQVFCAVLFAVWASGSMAPQEDQK